MSGQKLTPNPAITWEKITEESVLIHDHSGLTQQLAPAHSRAFLAFVAGDNPRGFQKQVDDLVQAGVISLWEAGPAIPRRQVVSGMASGAVIGALWFPTASMASSETEPTLIAVDLSSADWVWLSGPGGFTVLNQKTLASFEGGTLFIVGETWRLDVLSFGSGLSDTAAVADGTRLTLGFDVVNTTMPTGTIQARLFHPTRHLISSPFDVVAF
jgi:hypothetical protein